MEHQKGFLVEVAFTESWMVERSVENTAVPSGLCQGKELV